MQTPVLLLIVFLAIWTLLAIQPLERDTWILENVIVMLALPALVWAYTRAPLTNTAYGMIFAFLVIHAIGSHYTYSEVPYERWLKDVTGTTINAIFGFERNHFDRFVHLLHGLLLTEPTRQGIVLFGNVRGLWSYLFAVSVTMASALLYELIEWGAAAIFGGDLGQAYLGTQGDVWDAHQDMALATLGAVVVAGIYWFVRRGREETCR